jgi:regulator of replication initiation timing
MTAGLISIAISVIGAIGVWISSRESRKATTTNTAASGRVEMEKEAYERARALDTETIRRQHDEIQELRDNQTHINEDVKMVHRENQQLHEENAQVREENSRVLEDNEHLRIEVAQLRRRFTLYQRGLPDDPTASIRERESDTHPVTDTNPMMERFDYDRE